jgi:hypothetical protein
MKTEIVKPGLKIKKSKSTICRKGAPSGKTLRKSKSARSLYCIYGIDMALDDEGFYQKPPTKARRLSFGAPVKFTKIEYTKDPINKKQGNTRRYSLNGFGKKLAKTLGLNKISKHPGRLFKRNDSNKSVEYWEEGTIPRIPNRISI